MLKLLTKLAKKERLGIDNTPTDQILINLQTLIYEVITPIINQFVFDLDFSYPLKVIFLYLLDYLYYEQTRALLPRIKPAWFANKLNRTVVDRMIKKYFENEPIDYMSLTEGMSDEDWAACVERNKAHLQIMLAKDFWTTQDLAPLQAAAA